MAPFTHRPDCLPGPLPPADGFRKQLVVLTAGGKVLALHNGDGRLLWSLDFGPAAGLRKLALWRLPHDVQHEIEVRHIARMPTSLPRPELPHQGSPQLAAPHAAAQGRPCHWQHEAPPALPYKVPFSCPTNLTRTHTLSLPGLQVVALATSSDSVTATVINAHTGAVLQTLKAQTSPPAALATDSGPDVLPLPQPVHDGTADQHVFVVAPAGAGGAAAVLPDTPAARAALAAARPGFVFWRADEAAGAVRGYGFTGRCRRACKEGVGDAAGGGDLLCAVLSACRAAPVPAKLQALFGWPRLPC